MASRERSEHSVGAATTPKQHRESAFRRGAGDFEERQLPGPRRFGFARSPPSHHHNNSSNNSTTIYSAPRSSDTTRQPTILRTYSASSRHARSPPETCATGRADARFSNDVRELSEDASSASAPSREVERTLDADRHPVFSQLALVLGYELAKKVTARHPHEFDLNRLANLALDIGIGSGAADAAPATSPAAAVSSEATDRSAASAAAATATDELRTEDIASSSVVEDDLIDWNAEAASHEVLSAPLQSTVEAASSSHLLD